MSTKCTLLRRDELLQLGEGFMWPDNGDELMPRECWDLIRSNPEHREELPVAGVVSGDGMRLATVALVSHVVHWGEREVPCMWDFSLYANKSARRPGVGGLLMRKVVREASRLGATLISYGGTPDANRLYEALRMRHLGRGRRKLLLLDCEPVVRRYLTGGGIGRVVTVPGNLVLRQISRLQRLRLKGHAAGTQLLRVDAVEEGDPLVDLDGAEFPKLKLTASLLNWRVEYARAIGEAQIAVHAVRDARGRCLARIVTRVAAHEKLGSRAFRDVRLMRILDLATAPLDGAVQAALYHVLGLAMNEQVNVLEIVSADEAVLSLCSKLGFLESSGFDLYASTPPRVSATEPSPALPSIQDWRLSMLASENAFY